jgi:predicted nucleotide-binding protein
MERRIFVSMTFDDYLTPTQNDVKWAIVDRIIGAGFMPHFFFPYIPEKYERRVIAQSPWSTDAVDRVIRNCVGAVMIGFPRWTISEERGEKLASDYTHYEAGIVHTLSLPMFMVLEEGIPWRGAFDGHTHNICTILRNADASSLDKPSFSQPFAKWVARVKDRKDIFLGYSSEAAGTAKNIARLLSGFGATVLDWQNFGPGTILEQITAAASRCSAGIFLFTNTDKLEGEGGKAAPRDNVVFEAGYFAHAKGHLRILIVREAGAKMPADLGGAIYAPLADRSNIDPIAEQLENFVKSLYS